MPHVIVGIHTKLREPHTSYGSRITSTHHLETLKGLSFRNLKSPNKSSSLRCIGVPVIHHRCLAYNLIAISVAAAVLLSTIWASSRHTLHHNILVRRVGMTGYLPKGQSVIILSKDSTKDFQKAPLELVHSLETFTLSKEFTRRTSRRKICKRSKSNFRKAWVHPWSQL